MHCVYPINFSVNVGGIESKAVDMRVIYDNATMQFTGAQASQIWYGTSLWRTGTTTVAINLGWASYITGSKYQLINWSDLISPLSGLNEISYYSRYFQTITNALTWYLDFYYVSGWNGDDSNIQSGVTNNFVDVLDTINSWYYEFVARPCIPDANAPLFTWYNSWGTQSYLNGIAFTIYDFTGEYYFDTGAYIYNNTVHYRWNGSNYEQASSTSTGIDNQYGVNSWTIDVSLVGLTFTGGAFTGELGGYYSWWTLVNTSFNLVSLNNSSLFNCTPISTSLDMWYATTWSGLDRGY